MKIENTELIVLVNDKPIREFGHESRTYVEGRPDINYKIQIKNHYGHRVLAIPSVDGLNPLTGKPATPQDKGYIVQAYSSVIIDGWRTSLQDVNAFVFDKKINSYSSKTEQGTSNCGVIGVVVFAEKVEPKTTIERIIEEHHYYHYRKPWFESDTYYPYPYKPIYPHFWMESSKGYMSGGSSSRGDSLNNSSVLRSMSCGDLKTHNSSEVLYACNNIKTSSSIDSEDALTLTAESYKLGTGWGEKLQSVVKETEFNRGLQLQVTELYYSDKTGLEALGIDLKKEPKVSKAHPQAFSGNFCTPPAK